MKDLSGFYFNGEKLTEESILAARQKGVDNCTACIEGAKNGDFRVNNLKDYIEWQEKSIQNYKNGVCDNTLGFLQSAYFIQTGKCIPLLP